MKFESENIEFKSQLTDEIYKEIIAFANTDGGIVYVGIDDQGNVLGLDDVDKEYQRLTNGIRDAIRPDVTMFIKYKLQTNGVISVKVGEGSNKPYFLTGKGVKPNGVYVRQGTSSTQASWEQIRQMIKSTDGDVYEAMRSLEQNLTFVDAAAVFKRFGVPFGEEKYLGLGIVDKMGMYTNLALLISDQCPHTTKMAVFADAANTVFQDRKEFTGSILKQLVEGYEYLSLINKTRSAFQGLKRIDYPDYPEYALREAYINAIMHREYSISASTMVKANETGIEFINFGSLLPGMAIEDIRTGVSLLRNKNLANIILRFNLIEAYGTGIQRIFTLYAQQRIQPEIQLTTNVFKIILPNQNAKGARDSYPDVGAAAHVQEKPAGYITDQMKQVLEMLQAKGTINDEDVGTLLGIRQTRVYVLMKQMLEQGLLQKQGRGKGKSYLPNDVI